MVAEAFCVHIDRMCLHCVPQASESATLVKRLVGCLAHFKGSIKDTNYY